MSKCLFVLILLLPYSALAQIVSGTSVVFNLSNENIVLAADSRGVHNDGSPPDNSYCKIAAFSRQFVFFSVGHARYSPTLSEVQGWDNVEMARDAINSLPRNGSLDSLAVSWSNAAGQHWNSFCALHGLQCVRMTEAIDGLLTSAAFIRDEDLAVATAAVYFDSAKPLTPIRYVTSKDINHCWSCGQRQGRRICAEGSHIDVAAKFCAERKHGERIDVRTPLRHPSESTKLAVKIVEMTIDAYEKSIGDVGGPVDAITITRGGGLAWNARKPNCPGSQN